MKLHLYLSVLFEMRLPDGKVYDPNLPFPCGAFFLVLTEFILNFMFLASGMAVMY